MTGTIRLTPDDIHDLIEVLDYRLAELQDELVHTDDRSYRSSLRDAAQRLESLRERVFALAAEVPDRAVPSPIARRAPPEERPH